MAGRVTLNINQSAGRAGLRKQGAVADDGDIATPCARIGLGFRVAFGKSIFWEVTTEADISAGLLENRSETKEKILAWANDGILRTVTAKMTLA